ncbi:hypothetical protein [Paracoccus pacificus]|uniref:H+/citrate symporter n=1 Tax=Paracoccus pacificus TaxID=1463598 RepID=A0ABW4R648_9RHOB
MRVATRMMSWAGVLPAGVILAVIARQYSDAALFDWLAGILGIATVAVFSINARFSRAIFVAIGVALTLWAVLSRGDWFDGVAAAARSGSLILATFTALVALRSAAITSAGIVECGRFLARQRPGLRYVALTIGGHLFGLILLYGAISLLGSLATESAAAEPDPEIRRHRTRRMLVAIQRGFISTLCWSPLAFSMVISTALVPGASWSGAVLFCLVNALILMVGGWAMDTIFKPQLTNPPPPRAAETGRWLTNLRPLLVLLSIVVAAVAVLHQLTGVSVVGAVITLVPLIALVWIYVQDPQDGVTRAAYTGRRAAHFVLQELPGYRGEMVLLFMAAYIGSLGNFILVPLLAAQGISFAAVPPLVILLALVWIIPVTGQIGMNPILAVSLILPLLPAPAAMGVSPAVVITAITAGWALSGTTSPFTASVLLVGQLGGIPPRDVGLVWNRGYVLVMGMVLSLWVTALYLLL